MWGNNLFSTVDFYKTVYFQRTILWKNKNLLCIFVCENFIKTFMFSNCCIRDNGNIAIINFSVDLSTDIFLRVFIVPNVSFL